MKSGYVDIAVNVEHKGRHKPYKEVYKDKLKHSHNPGMQICIYQHTHTKSITDRNGSPEKRERQMVLVQT